jgi:arginine:agmatine antiporter
MGVLGAAALVAGSMIGSGVYLLPASLASIGSISILGWLAATGAALALAAMFAWLAAIAPDAEGLAGYVQVGLGRFFGVQATVVYWACNWVGTVAVALAAAGYAGFLIPALAAPAPRLFTTLAVIWLGVTASWIGPRVVARVEGVTLFAGLAPILLVAVAGWFWFDPGLFARGWNPSGAEPFAAVRSSALTAFWAFLGLECAAAVAGVVRDPARNVPRATMVGVLSAATLYIAACTVLMGLLPAAELARSSAPFSDATRAILGIGGAGLIAVCAFLRAGGCATGWVLVTAETTREAADQDAFLPAFKSRPGEPASAVNLLTTGGLMSLVAVLTATPTLGAQFARLANVAVILSLMVYVLAAFSLLRLRGRFRTSGLRAGATATAIVAVACAIALIASASAVELAWACAPPLAAAVLYMRLRRR